MLTCSVSPHTITLHLVRSVYQVTWNCTKRKLTPQLLGWRSYYYLIHSGRPSNGLLSWFLMLHVLDKANCWKKETVERCVLAGLVRIKICGGFTFATNYEYCEVFRVFWKKGLLTPSKLHVRRVFLLVRCPLDVRWVTQIYHSVSVLMKMISRFFLFYMPTV